MPGRKKKSEAADEVAPGEVVGAVEADEESKTSGAAAEVGVAADNEEVSNIPPTKKGTRKSKVPKEPTASRPRKEVAKGTAKGTKRQKLDKPMQTGDNAVPEESKESAAVGLTD